MNKKALIILLGIIFCFGGLASAEMGDQATLGWDYTNDTDTWRVDSNGDFIPGTDSTYDVGSTSKGVAEGHFDTIYLGGTSKSSWGSVVTPMTDASGYVYPTDASTNLKLHDDGDLTVGGGAATDVALTFDGNADDFYMALDDSADDLVLGYGSTIGTDSRLTFVDSATVTTIKVGDATTNDMQIYFDGNAQDYHIGLDDTADDLVIGLGSALGTTTAIGIDENLAVATYGDITMNGTTPALTVGDGGAEDAQVNFDGNSYDFHIGLDDTADDLIIGKGTSLGTTPAISITDGLAITTYADIVMTGTTPKLTVGDGDTEDAAFNFDGNAQDYHIAVDDSRDMLVLGNGTTLGSGNTAISIDSSNDVMLDAGNLTLVDDEYINLGTNDDYQLKYDETTNDQLLLTSTATAAAATGDPMFHFVVDDGGSSMTANQEVFGIAKGSAGATDLLTLDEDGDALINGTLALSAGDDLLSVTNDDELKFISNDGATTIASVGFEANDALLLLDADQGDDNTDSWTLEAEATGNDFTINNHTTEVFNLTSGGNLQADGTATFADALIPQAEVQTSDETATASTNAGTVDPDVTTTYLVTDGGSDTNEDTFSLADGTAGEIKIIVYKTETDGGDSANVTPANGAGFTDILFEDPGDGCIMIFDGAGWSIVSNNGGTIT